MTLTFELGLDSIRINQDAKFPGLRSFR